MRPGLVVTALRNPISRIGVVKVLYEHKDDEANTPSMTTVRLKVGEPISGTTTGTGIHWHMNRANEVEFVALDGQREQIPDVRVATPDGRVREYFAEGVTAASVAGKPRRRMDCLDCHNRPAHRFSVSPEREMDGAIGAGQISTKIPFIRREAVRAARRVRHTGNRAPRDRSNDSCGDECAAAASIRRIGIAPGDRGDAKHLPAQRLSWHEGGLGHVSEPDWPHNVDGLLPLPRRESYDSRGAHHPAGRRAVSHDRVTKKKSVESARYLG